MKIGIFCWAAVVAGVAFGSGVELADGKTVALVVPKERAQVEWTAEQELVDYVAKATGAKLAVVTEGTTVAGPAIHLGATALAKENVSDLTSFGEEEWTVRSVGDNLVIAGGRYRGVLYAAYHFIEDVLGVRWLSPVAEFVPAKRTVTLEGLNLRGKPAMSYRSIYLMPGEQGGRFLVRNRGNDPVGAQYGTGTRFGGGRDCHTMYSTLGTPDEVRQLYREHPDWFPLIKGKRYCHVERGDGASQSQLCLTNPELRRYWVGKLRTYMEKSIAAAKKAGVSPPSYYAVDQNDCFDGYCQCENCQAIANHEESNAGLLLDFANYVAAELEDVAEGGRFQMMALHSTEKPPKYLKSRHNVTIRLCDTTSNLLQPWTAKCNAKHYENLLAWQAHADAISMWDYQITYGTTACVCYPTPAERTFAADIRALRDHKGDGFFFEHESPVGGDMRDLKVWLEFKLAENPDLDGGALIRTFTDLYYGPAAGAEIRAYRDMLGEAADKSKAHVGWYPALANYSFLSATVVRDAYACYERALTAVRDDMEKTARVEHAFLSLDRFYLATSSAKRRQLAKTDPSASLPDVTLVRNRYQRVFEHEMKARGYAENVAEYKCQVTEFLDFVDKSRDLPVPAKFKTVNRDALFLFPATFASIYCAANSFADDSESPAGRVFRSDLGELPAKFRKGYEIDKWDWPLNFAIWPTMKGTIRGQVLETPMGAPKGYAWYKVAEDVQLMQDSVIGLVCGSFFPLTGAVSDNSELGQKYDIYASIKVEGPDIFKTGKATRENVISVDQLAVVRKTLNGAGTTGE